MNYNKKTVKDIDVKGRKVLLRCDFNVPQDKATGAITDDKRIRAALPTIQYLLDQGAAVIACSHLGKPEPSFDKWAKKQAEKGKDPASLTKEKWEKTLEALCMEPVAKRLSELLGRDVVLAADVVGPDAQAKAAALKGGEIMLLQNTRFEKGETKNDPELAKQMAALAGEGGGALRRFGAAGDALDTAAPFWPKTQVIFMPAFAIWQQHPEACCVIFDDYELRACGFSRCGDYMAVACPHTLDIYRRR